MEKERNYWIQRISYNALHERTENADGYTRVYWALTSADDFTDECKKIAQDEKIQLINGKEFASMLIDAGLANVNDAF